MNEAISDTGLFSDDWRLRWVGNICIVGFVTALLLSWPLWIGERLFTAVPLSEMIAGLPAVFWKSFFVAIPLCLLLALLRNKRHVPLFVAAGFLILFLLADQVRWRAAVYVYSTMLGGVALASVYGSHGREDAKSRVLHALRLALACVYMWAGLHKFNAVFITDIFPWVYGGLVPSAFEPLLPVIALVIPFIEASVGVCLVSKKFRSFGVVMALGMHCTILLALGPFGHGWNAFVWPWNIAMSSLVVVLFWQTGAVESREILRPAGSRFHSLVFALYLLLPATNPFGFWDAYPSFSLYTGDTAFARIEMSVSDSMNFPAAVQPFMEEREGGVIALDVQKWANAELGLPPYPEERIYRAVIASLCRSSKWGKSFRFYLYSRPSRLTGKRRTTAYRCEMSAAVTVSPEN
jgi:hypothetical protein